MKGLVLLALSLSALFSASLQKYDVPFMNSVQQINVQRPVLKERLSSAQMNAINVLRSKTPEVQREWIAKMRTKANRAMSQGNNSEANYYFGIINYWNQNIRR